ncbi:unnamed protein product [Cylindrotheca closterium]|uniref:Uncharacterized protein n=1 Tax=Cylindrotheca closterium TaxID=2856 RepID=A0AAD2FZI8_9STRA|nr:unnamed protein product [Cylindrotheca closterium]
MCEPQKTTVEDIRVYGSNAPSSPPEANPSTPNKPRRRPPATLKKMQSAPNLHVKFDTPNPSVWGIVKAVQKIQVDEEDSIYSEVVKKYVAPEFNITIPLTPHTETKKKLVVPRSTGRMSERLPKMNQVPPIFDILMSPRESSGGYSQTISKAEQERIREILQPAMGDDDDISEITSSIRSSKKKKKSSSKKRSSRKLKKSNSLPSILVEDDEEYDRSFTDLTLACSKEGDNKADKKLKKSSSDRSLTSKKSPRSRSKTLRKSSSDRSLTSKRSSRRSSSKNKKTRRSKSNERSSPSSKRSSRKSLQKSNSSPCLTNDDDKKLKKSSSERSLSKGPRKRRTRKPRSKSVTNLGLDSTFDAETEALKAEFEETLRQAKFKLESENAAETAEMPPKRRSGAHEEERIRVFAEATRRSQSLSPTKYSLGTIDGYRRVVSNDRRFSNQWSKVIATPPKMERRWSAAGLRGGRAGQQPPAIEAL